MLQSQTLRIAEKVHMCSKRFNKTKAVHEPKPPSFCPCWLVARSIPAKNEKHKHRQRLCCKLSCLSWTSGWSFVWEQDRQARFSGSNLVRWWKWIHYKTKVEVDRVGVALLANEVLELVVERNAVSSQNVRKHKTVRTQVSSRKWFVECWVTYRGGVNTQTQ